MDRGIGARRGDETALAVGFTCERRYTTFEIIGLAHVDWSGVDAVLRRHFHDFIELGGADGSRSRRVFEHCDPFDPRSNLHERLQPFAARPPMK